MAGNVGVQSSAIIVQGIASNSLGFESVFSRLLRELGGAFINGLTCSALMFLWNYFNEDSFALTMTVSIALFVVIIFAAIAGTIIPLMLHKAKVDPALATGPFITTLNDIVGLFIYLAIGGYFYSIL